MSEALVQTIDQPAVESMINQPEQSAGFMDGVYNLLREHPLAAKLAVGIGMLGAGGAVEMATADTAAASHTWSVLGGDPFKQGGVHSKAGLTRVMSSAKGKRALRDEGLNNLEVNAVELAVNQRNRGKEVTNCTLNAGDHFTEMAFGQFGEVESDVTYTAESAPAYCVSVKVPEGNKTKTIDLKIPQKCANIAIAREVVVKQHKPEHHKRRTAPVEVVKIAENDQGHILPATPTGEFVFEEKCRLGSKVVDRPNIVYNHTPQNLGRCNVGSKVTVTELTPRGPEQWKFLTPAVQKMKVMSGKLRNKFVFKDQEVPPIIPTTPPPTTTPPKDGTQGPGAGTPGQPGGPGAGGQPGNPSEGAPCYDDNSTTNGDLNPSTPANPSQPDILYGTSDQFGNCVGPAQPMQNA